MATSGLPNSIQIVEVGPRDGLQNQPVSVPTASKVALIERAIAAGARRVEATAFVHPKWVPQMADAEAVMAAVPRRPDVSYIGVVLNRRGFERAVAAGVDEVHAGVFTTDTFNQKNQGMTTEEALASWAEIAGLAHRAGVRASVSIAAAFGCPFEGEVPPSRVIELARRVADAGPAEIGLGDTIGVGVPTQVTELIEGIAATVGPIPLRCHFHNTRNTGYANAAAAVAAGVSALDASVGGLGGCPFAPAATGNIATEDLTYLLERMGVSTGISLDTIARTGLWMEELGLRPEALLGRAGPFPQ
jgi:hydroxymethylglutaryl-CoA lyase